MKTITLTVSNRPHYLKRCLETLSKCVGIENYVLVIGLEPNCSSSREICESIDFIEKRIVYNQTNLGVTQNPFSTLEYVFSFSNYNVYLEEDVVVSPDILNLADWYFQSNLTEEYLAMALSIWSIKGTESPFVVFPISPLLWMAFGWAMGKKEWEYIKPFWFLEDSWDHSVRRKLEFLNKKVLAPQYSRCNHIGEFGAHSTPRLQKSFDTVFYYQGDPITNFILT